MKKNFLSKQEDPTIKCSIFDIPCDIFKSKNWNSFYMKSINKTIPFQEFKDNCQNYEYLKEFHKMNQYKPHLTLINSET